MVYRCEFCHSEIKGEYAIVDKDEKIVFCNNNQKDDIRKVGIRPLSDMSCYFQYSIKIKKPVFPNRVLVSKLVEILGQAHAKKFP